MVGCGSLHKETKKTTNKLESSQLKFDFKNENLNIQSINIIWRNMIELQRAFSTGTIFNALKISIIMYEQLAKSLL